MGELIFTKIYTMFSLTSFNFTTDSKMPLNYFEYNRGIPSPVIAQARINYPDYFNYTLYDVVMYDYSFSPDNLIIPNAFIGHLFSVDIVNAVKAFTEPYYGIRF